MSSSSFYSVLSGLQPTGADVLEAEQFAQQYLQANFPDTDFRQGTALFDLVIQPTSSMVALLKAAIEFYFSNYTVQGVTDQTPTDFVDALMSNWFSNRNLGTNAVINATLYFASQVDVSLSPSQYFSPDSVLLYSPATNIVYPASSLQFDTASQEYYVTVNLTAQQTGPNYNLPSGNLLFYSNFNPFFLRGVINYVANAGISTETNTQFLTRTQSNISTRNLINRPSITSFVQDNFPDVITVQEIGYGDPQMQRDYQTVSVSPTVGTFTNVGIHLGGKVDVYCYVPVTTQTELITLDSYGNGVLTGPNFSITLPPSGSQTGTIPASAVMQVGVVPNLGDVGFSSRQQNSLTFSPTSSGETVLVQYQTFGEITGIQSAIQDPNNRVLCADLLARGFNSYFLSFNIETYNAAYSTSIATLSTAIQGYINSLTPGQAFIVGDLLATLNISQVVLPLTISYTLYTTQQTVIYGSFVDVLEPADNTYAYYIGNVTFNNVAIPSGPYSS